MAKKPIVTALTIGGSDSSCGAGIQADLKAFASLGVHGTAVITCVTAQNTTDVTSIYPLPNDIIGKQFDTVVNDFKPMAIKTGMLYNANIVSYVGEKLKRYGSHEKLKIVVDPVMSATVGSSLLKSAERRDVEEFLDTLRSVLLPQATVFTPNIDEATIILGWKVKTLTDMKKACEDLHKLGCDFVLLKGGHLTRDKSAVDVLYDGSTSKFELYSMEYVTHSAEKRIHGTGCTYSALITGLLAKGSSIDTAVQVAKENITTAIQYAYAPGKGVYLADQFGKLKNQAVKYEVQATVERAVNMLEELLPLSFIPEVGINIAYALPYASSLNEVCAIDGRIIRTKDGKRSLGHVAFGCSEHIGNVILTAMKFNPRIRAAMNIRFSSEVLDICRKLKFTLGSFNRGEESPYRPTMEWGTEYVIKQVGWVPDIIYDEGSIGKEPMIRILGTSPNHVLNKLKKIIDKMLK
jgi:hydroxymethylpyrimidine/phosphomethylpyrimidine kinase